MHTQEDILEMMKMGDCRGVRVNEITQKTHLSRPAVSHHLQILKEALQKAIRITFELPDRSKSDEY